MTAKTSQTIDTGRSEKPGSLGSFWQTFLAPSLNVHNLARRVRRQRGAAAVEFAVVAPVFVLLIFGMIEYGRMVMVQQMLTNASREGARRAVLEGATETDVTTVIENYLTPANIPVTSGDITIQVGDPPVTASLASAQFGDPIHVSVGVNFGTVSWLPSPMYLSTGTRMTATSVMRKESVN